MQNGGSYKTDKFTAYFYKKSIVICTNNQCFRISTDRYNQMYIDMLALDIIRGKIRSLYELRDYNGALKWGSCNRPVIM